MKFIHDFARDCFKIRTPVEGDVILTSVDHWAGVASGACMVFNPEQKEALWGYLKVKAQRPAFERAYDRDIRGLLMNALGTYKENFPNYLAESFGGTDKMLDYMGYVSPVTNKETGSKFVSDKLGEMYNKDTAAQHIVDVDTRAEVAKEPLKKVSEPSEEQYVYREPEPQMPTSMSVGKFGAQDSNMDSLAGNMLVGLSNLMDHMNASLEIAVRQANSVGKYTEFSEKAYEEFMFAYDNVDPKDIKDGIKHIIRSMYQNKNEAMAYKMLTELLNLLETKDRFVGNAFERGEVSLDD